MKIRTGFVTNSSSSSYVCEICGNVEAGYDLGLSDAEMFECENSHEICNHHLPESKEYYTHVLNYIINNCNIDNAKMKAITLIGLIDEMSIDSFKEELKKIIILSSKERYGDDDEDEYDNRFLGFDYYSLPEPLCPVCNLYTVTSETIIKYLYKSYNTNEKEISEKIQKEFKNLDEIK